MLLFRDGLAAFAIRALIIGWFTVVWGGVVNNIQQNKLTDTNPYKAPSFSGKEQRHHMRRWVWISLSLGSGIVAIWMAYGAAFAVWLNAHPKYDDEYWAFMFYLYAGGFCVSVCVATFSVARSLRRVTPPE